MTITQFVLTRSEGIIVLVKETTLVMENHVSVSLTHA